MNFDQWFYSHGRWNADSYAVDMARKAWDAGAESSASGRNMLSDIRNGQTQVINDLRDLQAMVLKTEGDFVIAGLSSVPICEYRYMLADIVRRLEKKFLTDGECAHRWVRLPMPFGPARTIPWRNICNKCGAENEV